VAFQGITYFFAPRKLTFMHRCIIASPIEHYAGTSFKKIISGADEVNLPVE
jgi:hypothetical protein